jgi:hypothetical protein
MKPERSKLIRLASTLPTGDPFRRAILAGLRKMRAFGTQGFEIWSEGRFVVMNAFDATHAERVELPLTTPNLATALATKAKKVGFNFDADAIEAELADLSEY